MTTADLLPEGKARTDYGAVVAAKCWTEDISPRTTDIIIAVADALAENAVDLAWEGKARELAALARREERHMSIAVGELRRLGLLTATGGILRLPLLADPPEDASEPVHGPLSASPEVSEAPLKVREETGSWSWDPAKGLASAKEWTIALASCTKTQPMVKLLGVVIREHVRVRTDDPDSGTVFVGNEQVCELTGWDRRNTKKRRAALVEAGWLVDTGDTRGRAKVYRLAIPSCDCGAHR
ncbi:hypothetical protein [Pseudonocardia sp. T1-2H]|uniref:hypothetical protein n=1 Tax=Pseudonocardia sp. T1-2H TaxID=3128899 RepID=UPI0031015C6B